MEKVEKNIVHYIHKHSFSTTVLVVSVFILLAIGEFLLYGNEMKINKMISEGLMQFKEEKRVESMMLKNQVMMKGGKILLRNNGHTAIMNDDTVLFDGTKITKDGYVIKSNGTKLLLKEGKLLELE